MELWDIIDSILAIVLVFSALVLAYRLYDEYGIKADPMVILLVAIIAGMTALLFLSISVRQKRMEEEMRERERSLMVSMQSVEDGVKKRVSTAVKSINEAVEEISKKGYR